MAFLPDVIRDILEDITGTGKKMELLCDKDTCCADRWVVEEWSPCSKTCGKLGYQTRAVQCMQAQHNGTSRPVHSKHCTENRPETRRPCNHTICPAQWRTGAWSQVRSHAPVLLAWLWFRMRGDLIITDCFADYINTSMLWVSHLHWTVMLISIFNRLSGG